MHPSLLIRAASPADQAAIWAILEPTIRAGEPGLTLCTVIPAQAGIQASFSKAFW